MLLRRALLSVCLVPLCLSARSGAAAALTLSPSTAAAAATASYAPGRGLSVTTGDGASAMTLRARVQMRDTLTVADAARQEVGIKTVRLVTHGHLFAPELRFFVQLALGQCDYEANTVSPLFDAYVEYALHRNAQVRVGQYFVPFDRARTIREFALQLTDRPQAISELNLDRDVGLSLTSSDLFGWGGKLNYAVGVFGGAGKNRTGSEPVGFLYVARVGLRPFGAFDDDVEGDLARLHAPRLAIGLAGAYNQNTQRQKSTFGDALKLGGFNYRHVAADVVFKYAGFSGLAEVLYRDASDANHAGLVGGVETREWSRAGWGLLVQTGFMLTDCVELAARWDRLRAVGTTDPTLVALARQQGDEIGGGLNLYLNGHLLKLQTDYTARVGAGTPIHMVRLQLDATF